MLCRATKTLDVALNQILLIIKSPYVNHTSVVRVQVAALDYPQDDYDLDIRSQYVKAPELVRRAHVKPTKPCDVYSFR